MSGRKRELPEPIAGLLRSLASPAAYGESIDRVPASFALPAEAVGAIHASADLPGTVSASSLPAELRALTRSRRCDLLGIAWTLLALAPPGRAALLVPERFLAEATQGHLQLRRALVEQGRLLGVIHLAAGCYKARSGAAIILLGPAETDDVWFCDASDAGMLQPAPDGAEPECLARWRERSGAERERPRADASFLVPRAEIAAAQFDLSAARYRITAAAAAAPIRRPQELLAELAGLEAEIFQGLRELVGMLKS